MGRFYNHPPRPPKKPKFVMPFHDLGRPNPPYKKGTYWVIQEHQAPPPFGEGYVTKHRRGPAALELMRQQQLPQSMYCLLNPPPGPEPSDDAPRLTIEIIEEIRVDAGRGAQVFGCRFVDAMGMPTGVTMAAKVYDPLYYCHNGDYDIVEFADMEYSREAAAYSHLKNEGIDGQLLPAYYGSFTMSVPLTSNQQDTYASCTGDNTATTRPVRLILTGIAEGTAMTYPLLFGDVLSMTDSMRMHTIGTCLEAYAKLYWHGLVHGDLAPRNVFLREIGPRLAAAGDRRQLVFDTFVDLGMAYVLGDKNLGSEHPRQPAGELRPWNPIRLFWNVTESGASNMYHWVPEHLRNTPDFQAWMLKQWYGDPNFEPIGPEPLPSAERVNWDIEKAPDGQGDKKTRDIEAREGNTRGKEVRVDPIHDNERQAGKAATTKRCVQGAYNGDGNYPKGFW